ncbi:MAG: ADP-forming succinate--CoA ligase subunit beta [Candidatus Methylomirabilales bacterium]
MDLFEYQGKELFARWGIPVPEGRVASTPGEAAEAAGLLGGRVAVKAQVRAGGRGKAGGIKLAGDPESAASLAAEIFGMRIRGERVERVLVERAAEVEAEHYVAVMLDRTAGLPLVMLSSRGGIDIEQAAADEPGAVSRIHVDPLLGLMGFQVRKLAFGAGMMPVARREMTSVLPKLYRMFVDVDALLVEVNPVVLTREGRLIALDSKVSLDDSALWRHPELEGLRDAAGASPAEELARARGLSFIKLDGNVGIIGNGAGLVMSTLDLVHQAGGRAANFLDVGGGAGVEALSGALEVVLAEREVRSVLVNIFGGITRCDLVAEGIVKALSRTEVRVPIVVRLDGTNAVEGRRLLAAADHPNVVAAATMLEAAEKAVEAAAV